MIKFLWIIFWAHQYNNLIAQWSVINPLQEPNDKREMENNTWNNICIFSKCFFCMTKKIPFKMASLFSE